MPRRSRSRSPNRRSNLNLNRHRERGERESYRRSRSRSRDRDKRDRDRDRRREGERDRYRRSRSKSPGRSDRRRTDSPDAPVLTDKKTFTAEDFKGKTDEEIEMMKLMGFGGFNTTKGKKVPGNASGAANISIKRTYRQYMNRRGGFNRPLDPVH